jgi:RNA polymerase sigma-70 factor (ECF subfamily)
MASAHTDNELLRIMFSGDQEAFAELYRRRRRDVYLFALHMSGAPDLAEDVTQEVFLTLIRAENGYEETRGSVNSYLLGIARNYVLRRLKQERYFVRIDEANDAEIVKPVNRASANIQLETLTRDQEITLMQNAILSLPAHYREVLVLCELQEMSYSEAAGVLGCAIGTVRSRLHRARTMLIEKLRPVRDESGSATEVKSQRCFA